MGFGLGLAAMLLGVGLSACGTGSSSSAPGGGSSVETGWTSGGELPEQCAIYADQVGGASPSVVIRNETERGIHLGPSAAACGSFVPFVIAPEGGEALSIRQDCPSLCSALMKGTPIACPGICIYPPSITLQPGESTVVRWSGGYYASATLPRECQRDSSLGESCTRFEKLDPGRFLFTARAGSELDCSQTTGSAECGPCEPLEAGGCATSAAVLAGDTLSAETTLRLDASYGVGASASLDPTPVELVFSP